VLHDGRTELERKLARHQQADGSWNNPDESIEPTQRSPTSITSLALLTLREIHR
jgi:hypothetical protein